MYKIGDRVRIVADNKIIYGRHGGIIGKFGTINGDLRHQVSGYWSVKLDEENNAHPFHESEFEKFVEPTPKSLLKNGHLIRMRSGEEYICLMDNPLNKIIFFNMEGWEEGEDYNDDLMLDPDDDGMREFDIMEIMEPKYGHDYPNVLNSYNFGYKSIWQRPEDDFLRLGVVGVKFDRPIISDGCNKVYLFEIPYTSVYEFRDIYNQGRKVIVETVYGNQIATVQWSKYFDSKMELNKLLNQHEGAKYPLKRVIGRVNEVGWK